LQYSFVKNSFRNNGKEFSAVIHEAKTNTHYVMTVTRYPDNIVRIQIDEQLPLRPRYRVQDVLLDEVVSSALPFGLFDEASNTLHLDPSTKLALGVDKLQINLLVDEVPVVSINRNGKFYYEYLRRKKGELSDAEAVSKPPEVEGIDFSDAWEETFGGDTDNKAHGPESVGVDFSFSGAHQVYGIPEHATTLALKETTGESGGYADPYRLYNLDVFEYEMNEPMALYGHVPFMIGISENRSTGVFWLNSAETWVDIDHASSTSGGLFASLLSSGDRRIDTHWMSEAGVIDIFIMTGPLPRDVLRQFTSLVGRQELPPLFSIAYHQCRWNYLDMKDVETVNDKFEEHDIPYDVLWLDIEHTDGKRYFTWDSRTFGDPLKMIEGVTRYGRKMVTIVDPHIKRDTGYHVHSKATELDYYVKDEHGAHYDGHCWPGSSSWLDFTDSRIRDWWGERFGYEHYKGSTPDVYVWNDMNEPSVFNGPEVTMKKDAKHHNGWEHRHVHNVYGLMMHRATALGLVHRNPEKNKRPFVLSRAFFAGAQRWGAIWTGDNRADWNHLAASEPMLMTLGLAGVSFVGADVGGFFGDPSPELLLRWYQVGAYQPFFRAHAHLDSPRREPWVHGADWMAKFRSAILQRYQILPYLYTLFYKTSLDGSPIMRPLWFDYPHEVDTFTVENQHLLGSDLLVVPALQDQLRTVEAHVPQGKGDSWVDVSNGSAYPPGKHSISAPLEKIVVLQRGGSIVPRKYRIRRSSSLMVNDPYTLTIALDKNGHAEGELYLDDGDSYNHKVGLYAVRRFTWARNSDGKSSSLTVIPEGDGRLVSAVEIERLIVFGVDTKPKEVTLSVKGVTTHLDANYDSETRRLVIRDPNVRVLDFWSISVKY